MQRQVVLFLAVAAGYAAGSQLAFSWFGADGTNASFFPAAGVALAALVLVERGRWPIVVAAVAAAELTLDLAHDIGPVPSVGYVVANAGQALAGAWLLTRVRPRVDLTRTRDLAAFLGCAVLAAPVIGAALGATTFTVLDGGDGWWRFAGEWWVGDGLGVLVVGGAILAFRPGIEPRPSRARLLEALALSAAAVAATVALFWLEVLPLVYIPVALLIVSGFRGGVRAVALTGAIVAFIAAHATAGGHTFWDTLGVSPSTGLLYLQLALALVIAGALGIAAAIDERERAAVGLASAERFQQLADAAPAMIWVTDADGRCTFLSRAWFERTGTARDAGLDSAWTQVVHPDDRAAAAAAFLDAAGRREPFAIDYRLRTADGDHRWAIDSGRPRVGPEGRFLGYVGSVIDVDERKRAEEALRESEGELRALFTSIEEGYCLGEMILGADGAPIDYRFLEVNAPFEAMTGVAGIRGRTARQVDPDLEPRWVETFARVALGRETLRFEEDAEALGRCFEVVATPVEPHGRFALVVADVTERHRAEEAMRASAERDRFRAALTDALRPLRDPRDVQHEAARMVGEHLGATRAFVAEAEPGGEHVVVHRDHAVGVASVAGRHRIADFGRAAVEALEAGRTLVVDDVAADPSLTAHERDAYAALGIRAHLSVWITRGGRLRGLLGLHQDRPRAWSTDEVALVEEVAQRLRAAMERAATERALRESEARFRTLADDAPDLIWLNDASGRCIFVNAGYERFFGRSREELMGSGWTEALHPGDAPRYLDAYEGATARRERFEEEVRIRRHDGEYRWMRSVGVPRMAGGVYRGYVGTSLDIHEARLERDRAALLARVAHELDQEIGVDERLARLLRVLEAEGVGDACRVSRVEDGGPGPGGEPLVVFDGPRAMATVPLSARGRTLAVLTVSREGGSPFTRDELTTLAAVGRRAGLAIDNAALFEAQVRARDQAERARRRVDELHRLAAALSEAVTVSDVARVGAEALVGSAGADSAWLAVQEVDGPRLQTVHTVGPEADQEAVPPTIARDADLPIATAARTGRSIVSGGGGACAVPMGTGAFEVRYDVPRSFTEADLAQLLALGRLVGQALARAQRFEYQRGLSTMLQRSLLPAALPEVAGLSVAHDYHAGAAGTEAGGDWYDALVLDDGRLAVTVGDVVGRGPRAATVMGQVRSALGAYLRAGAPPAVALGHLNAFAASVDGATGTTAVCLVVEPDTGDVTWARAGHPPPLVVEREGATYAEELPGPLLGLIGNARYAEGRFTLPPGGSLLAYSDGLIERRDAGLDAAFARLAEVAVGAPRWSAQTLLAATRDASLPAGGVQDDVVLLVVTRRLPPLELVAPGAPAALGGVRRAVRDWIGPLGLPEPEVGDVIIALGEALANAVEHAYADGPSGPVMVRMTHEADGSVAARVEDHGRWRSIGGEDRRHRGRGLALMRAVMDEVVVSTSPEGTLVELRYRPRSERAAMAPAPAGPGAGELRIEVDETVDGDGVRLAVLGELDDATAPQLTAAVARSQADGGPLVIDLRDTTYVGSAGVRALAEALERLGAAVVVAPGSGPARVLALVGLDAAQADPSPLRSSGSTLSP